MSTLPDGELLMSAVSGNKDALGTLLLRHGGVVRQAVASDIGPKYRSIIDEDDVMQVTYLEAFLRIRDLRTAEVGAFIGWLKQIARNNLQDAIKGLTAAKRPDPRRQARPTSPDESALALFEIAGMDPVTASQVVGQAERKTILTEALRQMPPDYAKVIREYDLEGQPIEVVAQHLGRSSGAVFMVRARAIERLKEVLPSISVLYGISRA